MEIYDAIYILKYNKIGLNLTCILLRVFANTVFGYVLQLDIISFCEERSKGDENWLFIKQLDYCTSY